MVVSLGMTGCKDNYDVALLVTGADHSGLVNTQVHAIRADNHSCLKKAKLFGDEPRYVVDENGNIVFDENGDPLVDEDGNYTAMARANTVLVTPDSTKAFITSSHYPSIPVGWRDTVVAVDLLSHKTRHLEIDNYMHTGVEEVVSVFDMKLTADGRYLVVGSFSAIRGYVNIFDTETLEQYKHFEIDLTDLAIGGRGLDTFRWGWGLVVHPDAEIVYVLASDAVNAKVRAYTFDGDVIDTFDGADEYDVDYCGLENFNDYKIAIDPEGELLLVVSSKVYAYRIHNEAEGNLESIYADGLDWRGSSEFVENLDEELDANGIRKKDFYRSATLHGKTEVQFADSRDIIYINSEGLQLGKFNFGGGSIILDLEKVLDGEMPGVDDPKGPYLYNIVELKYDIIPWLVEDIAAPLVGLLTNDRVEEFASKVGGFLGDIQCYGIVDSEMVDDVCYMVIAPIMTNKLDPVRFVGFRAYLDGIAPARHDWVDLDYRPDHMAVSPDRKSMILTNSNRNMEKANNMVEFFERKGLQWKTTGFYGLADDEYPLAVGMASVPTE